MGVTESKKKQAEACGEERMNVVSIILSIVSMICAGLSIGFTLSARNDEKKLEELRRLNDKSNNANNDSDEREE